MSTFTHKNTQNAFIYAQAKFLAQIVNAAQSCELSTYIILILISYNTWFLWGQQLICCLHSEGERAIRPLLHPRVRRSMWLASEAVIDSSSGFQAHLSAPSKGMISWWYFHHFRAHLQPNQSNHNRQLKIHVCCDFYSSEERLQGKSFEDELNFSTFSAFSAAVALTKQYILYSNHYDSTRKRRLRRSFFLYISFFPPYTVILK